MAIQLIIDSASDMLPEEAEQLGMIHVPLTVCFSDREYQDGVEISHMEFYRKLEQMGGAIPSTSQVSPAVFQSVIEKVLQQGDVPLLITISSGLSGTFQSARIAADSFEEAVYVIDSENGCHGERILILRALELIQQGLSIEEIVETLEKEKKKIRLFILMDTLEYIKTGGRINHAIAIAGNLLSIKPVVQVVDGKVELVGKARGKKKGNKLLRECITSVDYNKPLAFAYSGTNKENLREFLDSYPEVWPSDKGNPLIASVGAVVGSHIGPGAISIAYFEN